MEEYIIWSLKLNAWWGKAVYTSVIDEARRFNETDAVAFCKKHADFKGSIACVPVALRVIDLVRK